MTASSPQRRAGRGVLLPRLVVCALSISIGGAAGLRAQQPGPTSLTLEAALLRAVDANRTIAAVRLQRSVATAGIGVARERLNPELSFEAARETPHSALSFSLPLELGGKRARRLDLANATVSASDADITRAIAEVQNNVRRAYFAVVGADRRVALAGDARTLAQRVRDTAATRVLAGDAPQFDQVQADIQLLGADQDITAARGEATAARADLNVLLGQPVEAPIALADGLVATALPSLADLLAQVREANTSIVALDRQIAAQVARRNLARAMKTPDVTAGAALTWDAMPEFHVGWRASAGITLPLFTTHAAAVAVEDIELTRLQAERAATLAATEAAVAASLARAAAAREQITRFDTNIQPLLARSEQIAQDGYAAGQTPLFVVLDALQRTQEQRAKGLDAAIQYQMALAELERAVGTRLR